MHIFLESKILQYLYRIWQNDPLYLIFQLSVKKKKDRDTWLVLVISELV